MPQGLKPLFLLDTVGTAEAAPYRLLLLPELSPSASVLVTWPSEVVVG